MFSLYCFQSEPFWWKLKNAFICSGNASPAWCNGLVKRQKGKKKEEKNMKRTNCKCDVKMDMQPTRFATSLTFLLKLFIHWKKKNVESKKKKNGRPSSALVNLRKGNRVSCKYILDIGDWKWHYCYCIAMQAEFCFCALLPLTLLVVCTICELMDCGAIEIMLSSIIC